MNPRHAVASMLALVIGGTTVTVPATARDAAAAPQTEPHVDAREEYFYPSSVTVRRGGTVVWDWTGEATHDAVDETGMALFDSGPTPPGGPSFSFTFVAAGSYPYVCTLHAGMSGRVEVPIRAAAADGGATVVWSSDTVPDGFALDVQVKRTGQRWRSWLEGTTELRETYPAVSGAFRFRARLRLETTGASSDWSGAASITIA